MNNKQLLRNRYLQQISFINLKKEAGYSTVDDECVSCYSEKHRKQIIDEIKIIDPDIIVACGVFESLTKDVLRLPENYDYKQMRFTEKMNNYGRYCDVSDYLCSKKPVYLVEYRHPSRYWFQGKAEEHCQNMLTIREIILPLTRNI